MIRDEKKKCDELTNHVYVFAHVKPANSLPPKYNLRIRPKGHKYVYTYAYTYIQPRSHTHVPLPW